MHILEYTCNFVNLLEMAFLKDSTLTNVFILSTYIDHLVVGQQVLDHEFDE